MNGCSGSLGAGEVVHNALCFFDRFVSIGDIAAKFLRADVPVQYVSKVSSVLFRSDLHLRSAKTHFGWAVFCLNKLRDFVVLHVYFGTKICSNRSKSYITT
jgi:hypothetical protein